MKINTLYNIDARIGLKQMIEEEQQVDCVITSPPYWSLRDYEIPASVWDGDPKCEHKWDRNEKIVRFNDSKWIGGNEVIEEKDLHKFKTRGDSFCFECGAWKGVLGLEPTFEMYIKHLCDIYDLVWQVLKDSGTNWVNIGDSYSTISGSNFQDNKIDHNKPGKTSKSNQLRKKLKIPQKCLLMLPQRFAIEMINRGWILRNVIIWHKPNAMPSSAKDRFTVDFEYVYFFVKKKKYYFEQQFESSSTEFIYSRNSNKGGVQAKNNPHANWEYTREELKDMKYKKPYAIIEPGFRKEIVEYRNLPSHEKIKLYLKKWRNKKGITIKEIEEYFGNQAGHHWFETNGSYPSKKDWLELKKLLGFDYIYDSVMTTIFKKSGMKQNYIQGRNKRTVWSIPTVPNPEPHFATFPPTLIEPMIKAGCPIEGIVLDIFAGVGTTLKKTWELGRDYIGFEISEKYCEIAKKKLKSTNNKRITDFLN